MSETIQEKRERRNALVKDTRNLLDKTVHPEWTEDLQQKYDGNMEQVEALDAEIGREQKLMDLEAEDEFTAPRDPRPAAGRREQGNPVFDKWLRGGDSALSAEDWHAVRNTMSTGTGDEGGYTVPEEWATQVLEALKAYGGMREVGTVIQTQAGGQMNYPTSNGVSEEGEIVPENTAATDADPDFGTKALNVYKFSSKVITVPIELIQDSGVDIEAFVRGRIEQRLGRITNRLFTVGTGTNQPTGIVTASAAGKVGATSATAAVTYNDLLDLQHSVDPAYRNGNDRWMMHDSGVKMIRKLVDNEGRPLYLPSYDSGIRGGVPAELMGRPLTINQHMAEPAPDAKSMLYGDFSNYIIRDVMAFTLFRFNDSAYAKKGQVGFLAWMRSGGNHVDVGGAVKHFQHGAAA